MSFEEVAASTVQILRGSSRGAGFHLFRPDLVVTNQHVLDMGAGAIVVQSEDGETRTATVIASSPVADKDFAVLEFRAPTLGRRSSDRA
jgi:S1-C subfamily serine protease